MRDERTPVLLGLPGFYPSVEPRRPRETVGSRTSQRASARNPSRQRQERVGQIAPLGTPFRNAYAIVDSSRKIQATAGGAPCCGVRIAPAEGASRGLAHQNDASTPPHCAGLAERGGANSCCGRPSSRASACPTGGHALPVEHRTEACAGGVPVGLRPHRSHNRMIPWLSQDGAPALGPVASSLQSVRSDGERSRASVRGTSSRAARVPAFHANASGPRAVRLRAGAGLHGGIKARESETALHAFHLRQGASSCP